MLTFCLLGFGFLQLQLYKPLLQALQQLSSADIPSALVRHLKLEARRRMAGFLWTPRRRSVSFGCADLESVGGKETTLTESK